MFNLVIVARSNVLTVVTEDGSDIDYEIVERLLDNHYASGKARILQHGYKDSEYYFEVDVQPGSTEYIKELEDAINDFNAYMYDYECKMFVSDVVPKV